MQLRQHGRRLAVNPDLIILVRKFISAVVVAKVPYITVEPLDARVMAMVHDGGPIVTYAVERDDPNPLSKGGCCHTVTEVGKRDGPIKDSSR